MAYPWADFDENARDYEKGESMGMTGKLFGGHGGHSSTTARQPAPRNNSSSDAAPDNEGPQSAFVGRHFEGLGDVWAAFFPGGSREYVEKLHTLFETSAARGPVMHRRDGSSVILLTSPSEGGISIHSHIVMKQGQGKADFVGGYPALEGLPERCVIEQAHIWSNGISGVVAARTCSMHTPLAFFLSGFFQHVPQLRFGTCETFHVAGLALSLEKTKRTEFRPEPGTAAYDSALKAFLMENPGRTAGEFRPPMFSSHGCGVLLPTELVGIWGFQIPVLGVEKTEFMGSVFLRILTLFAGFGEQSVQGYLYVAGHVLGTCEPQIGDDVTGTLWMQGALEGCPGETEPAV